MRILVDMNLSPQWCPWLRNCGVEAVHWSEIDDPGAADSVLLRWAREHDYVVLTHDLDFGAILAASDALGPSVVQMRVRDVMPATAGPLIINALRQHDAMLQQGALMSIEPARNRVRFLPLRGS
jgi:predicted nuclease of predicted toxin-antitoxin system